MRYARDAGINLLIGILLKVTDVEVAPKTLPVQTLPSV
jgi:hypothetical protein